MFFLCQVFATAIIMVYFLQFFLISQVTEACAEPFQIYKVDFFAKIVTYCNPLNIFAKFLS